MRGFIFDLVVCHPKLSSGPVAVPRTVFLLTMDRVMVLATALFPIYLLEGQPEEVSGHHKPAKSHNHCMLWSKESWDFSIVEIRS